MGYKAERSPRKNGTHWPKSIRNKGNGVFILVAAIRQPQEIQSVMINE